MSSISELSYELVKKGLQATTLRNQVISNNIANVNIKDFKKSVVTFEETLKEVINEAELKTTTDRHITIGKNKEFGSIDVVKKEDGSMNANGNNVDIDQEMANSAANAMLYNVLVQSASGKFAKTNSVINSK